METKAAVGEAIESGVSHHGGLPSLCSSTQQFVLQSCAAKTNNEVKEQIAQLAAAHPTYGYRRITAMLHRAGHQVNKRREYIRHRVI